MKQKTTLTDIVDIFLTTSAEAEGLTEKKEVAEYIKNRKESIKNMVKKVPNAIQ